MKYEIGDKIIVLLTDEEGTVVDIMNEKMVMVEVRGVRFPAYMDQIDFPYFKIFSQKPVFEKKKIYVDNVQKEKILPKKKTGEGVWLNFIPVFDKDVFEDDVVEKLKVYLINQNEEEYKFSYNIVFGGESHFELKNIIRGLSDFYLHDVKFEDLSDSPKFEVEFSLVNEHKKKAPYFETFLKLKGKQLFKKIEELKLKNEPSFSYELFREYPDKVEEEKVDMTRLGNAGYRMYDVSAAKENLSPARSVVDLHIERLTDNWKHLSNFDILTTQLNAFEKYYELALAHRQPELIVIHGIGEGRLRDEIHERLRLKDDVKSFVNQFHHSYGYGATEIYFK
ncbi:MAG: Smr/MutS family protein [Ferruginibacter sp.]|nr:Smr/MutS family protein [Ferruginibacter sp.]